VSSELANRIKAASQPFHDDGATILFFRGIADRIELVTWMPSFPSPGEFLRLDHDLWYLRLMLPATARIEYRLRVTQGSKVVEIDDPANPPSTSNPFGKNSVLAGPGYREPWYAGIGFEGELFEIRVTSTELRGRRHHHVYVPRGLKPADAQALLLVHDGSDFLQHGGLGIALDRLLDKGSIPPLVAVLLDPWDRINEYSGSPQHSAHVVKEVIPHLSRRLRVQAPSHRTMAMGSSLGAVAALALSYHHPEMVARVASLSGSYFHQAPPLLPPLPVIDFLAELDPSVLKEAVIYQSVGRYEGLVDSNRRLRPILAAAGTRVRLVETWTGHDWEAWRDRLEDALAFLMPRSESAK
jgi:enterochelin esterase family protein